MVHALKKLPINASLLKKTKIGKEVNYLRKGKYFDTETNDMTEELVYNWKKLVKDTKQGLSEGGVEDRKEI